jgi:hypothetical protein
MRLLLASLLILAGCGGDDPDPHAVGACDTWTDNQGNPFTGMCEAACEKPPANTGATCDTVVKLACVSFEFGDADGCCVADGSTIRFYECQ